ncbi:hypothetical protein JYP51_15055 [Ponticoccus gilvus]|nr:hypothetical protein [Enemella evansiae]
MSDPAIYGTEEPLAVLRRVAVGSLSFLWGQEALRQIRWHGVEVVRALAWPIRDESWGTWPVTVEEEQLEEGAGFAGRLRFTVAEGALRCLLEVRAEAGGRLTARLTMDPGATPFRTNRAGFTVLHPIRGVAGADLTVSHSDGTQEQTGFPALISPDQPVKDIAGLRHTVAGVAVDIAFGGEVFEMEDQRNWSDASYKTYCVPLVHPFVYTLEAPVTQSVTVTLSGAGDGGAAAGGGRVALARTGARAPQIGLALEPGWEAPESARDIAVKTGVGCLLVRLAGVPDPAFLAIAASMAARLRAEVDVEIVTGPRPEAGIAGAADALADAGLAPRRVLALPEGYLGSHQPSGPWPRGATPAELLPMLRRSFPMAEIGGGVMTNFTELNRCRPDMAQADYLTHGNTAIVHAGDDLSVLETLECLPQIFESAGALAAGKPYRLGLVSIGMRSNPYGADVAANPAQLRRTMGRADPRHRGLFGTAWAVGVLAASAGSAVASLCLAAPAGPFGVAVAEQDYPQAGYDGRAAQVYPLFHVVAEAAALAGAPRLGVSGLPEGVVGYAADRDGLRMMLANLGADAACVTLPAEAEVALMDAGAFEAATEDADWLASAPRERLRDVTLPPFAVAFARIAGRGAEM